MFTFYKPDIFRHFVQIQKNQIFFLSKILFDGGVFGKLIFLRKKFECDSGEQINVFKGTGTAKGSTFIKSKFELDRERLIVLCYTVSSKIFS